MKFRVDTWEPRLSWKCLEPTDWVTVIAQFVDMGQLVRAGVR